VEETGEGTLVAEVHGHELGRANRPFRRAAGAPRPAERVVHVQIGRLEVSAAPPPDARRPPGGGGENNGRRAPALSLDSYLARGGEG
ncbi:hypothetical protein ABT391_30780, partial [Streptomyces jumonjinensis]